jgi:hypothetical protein
MIFEVEYLKIVLLLDPTKGRRHAEPVKGKYTDNLSNMTTQMDDYVNTTKYGLISWRSISSCMLDSEEDLENW